jgi:hypothetical protein
MLRRVAHVITDVSEERIASIIRVTTIGELETTLAVTINWRTLPHGVTSQKTEFFFDTNNLYKANATHALLVSGRQISCIFWAQLSRFHQKTEAEFSLRNIVLKRGQEIGCCT